MKNALSIAVVLAAAVSLLPADAACLDGDQASGAVYRICMPETAWNGDLILYEHGYTSPLEAIELPGEFIDLPASISVDKMFTGLGYAFAGSSYSTNGLAVQQGMADTLDLLQIFTATYGAPDHVYLLGISMGGLVATLLGEQYPEQFDGVLCGCAPMGSFQNQINWFGDFRVIFDHFFPWLIPGPPTQVPRVVQDLWPLIYAAVIRPAVFDELNAGKLADLAALTDARIDPDRPEESLERTIQILLWYNVFSTNDARQKLGGQPFDNTDRSYDGIPNAFWFNGLVRRFSADPGATAEIATRYETTGAIEIPYVSLHTTLDPLVPYEQVGWYREKIARHGALDRYYHIPTERYGHCLFGLPEVVAGLGLVVRDVEGQEPSARLVETALKSPLWGLSDRSAFRELAQEYGLTVPPEAPAPFPLLELLLSLLRRLLGNLL